MRTAILGLVGIGMTAVLCIGGAPTAEKGQPDLGVGASLHARRVFPADDPWNQDISTSPVDPNSDAILATIGLKRSLHADFGTVYNNAPNGIPYVIVSGTQKKSPVDFVEYPDESDKGPYPIPTDAPVEGGVSSPGDRHVIVIDRDSWMLYELWHATPVENGTRWKAGCGAIFDLSKNTARPVGWTSADAAGLPIFPGLVRYDEVVGRQVIDHAIRFTVQKSRRAYVPPAKHFASRSNDVHLPPMGMRVRLKAGFDVSPFPPCDQVILKALKKYGMIVADNGGNWFMSGSPDARWNDEDLGKMSRVHGSDFEVIRMDGLVAR